MLRQYLVLYGREPHMSLRELHRLTPTFLAGLRAQGLKSRASCVRTLKLPWETSRDGESESLITAAVSWGKQPASAPKAQLPRRHGSAGRERTQWQVTHLQTMF